MKDDLSVRRTALRELFAGQSGEIVARHPQIFTPNWRTRATAISAAVMIVGLYAFGLSTLEMTPVKALHGVLRLWDIIGLMLPPNPETWARVHLYLIAMGQTLAIALLGTLLAAVLAVPFGFLAARNIIPNMFAHFVTRRALDTVRSVDTLIWALIWINVVGLGPFAGVLAIMSSDFGAFGKLISEAIETADNKSVEGIISTGGQRVEVIRFGIVPQVLPIVISQILYFFESNVRSATIVGIVGAGGIGLHLDEQIRVLEWQQVSFLILMILVTVAIIDMLSQRLRAAVIGARS
jgi:phosphonate transport system permease protein